MSTSAVQAQSISTGGNTLNACAEGKYKNGGPATPLYDYAGEVQTPELPPLCSFIFCGILELSCTAKTLSTCIVSVLQTAGMTGLEHA